MFEYLMIWMPLSPDRRAMTTFECGMIAVVIAGAIVAAFVLAGTDLAATFSARVDEV